MTSLIGRRSLLKMGAFGGVLWIDALTQPARANDVKVGQVAPTATLLTLDGRRLSTPELMGQVVILTFWATWCAPCREELPMLSDYAARHASEGLTVLGFSLDTSDKITEVRRISETLAFPTGLYTASSAPGYGRIWRLPVSFTIDRRGILVEDGWKRKNSALTRDWLELNVTPLLNGKS